MFNVNKTKAMSNESMDVTKAESSVYRPHFYLETSVCRGKKCLSRIAYCFNMCITYYTYSLLMFTFIYEIVCSTPGNCYNT